MAQNLIERLRVLQSRTSIEYIIDAKILAGLHQLFNFYGKLHIAFPRRLEKELLQWATDCKPDPRLLHRFQTELHGLHGWRFVGRVTDKSVANVERAEGYERKLISRRVQPMSMLQYINARVGMEYNQATEPCRVFFRKIGTMQQRGEMLHQSTVVQDMKIENVRQRLIVDVNVLDACWQLVLPI